MGEVGVEHLPEPPHSTTVSLSYIDIEGLNPGIVEAWQGGAAPALPGHPARQLQALYVC